MRLVLMLIIALVAAELFARFQLGLGDPPLMMADPKIEYLYQPSKSYNRFGNVVAFNRWSMRSDDFSETKVDPNELRILVIGDSVVNGGAQTDQRNIATEIIRSDLATRLKRPLVVGNVSAGSWGPPNMLAYVERFGFFDADVVIIVLSSHDWNDAPTFGPLGIDAPTHKPLLALQEAIARYLPRCLPDANDPTATRPTEPAPDDPTVIQSLDAVAELVRLALQSGAKVAVAEHLERDETMDHLKPGHSPIADVAKRAGANVIQLGPSFAQARQSGQQPYRDEIHPNELGQRIIAQVLEDWIIAMIRENTSATHPSP